MKPKPPPICVPKVTNILTLERTLGCCEEKLYLTLKKVAGKYGKFYCNCREL